MKKKNEVWISRQDNTNKIISVEKDWKKCIDISKEYCKKNNCNFYFKLYIEKDFDFTVEEINSIINSLKKMKNVIK